MSKLFAGIFAALILCATASATPVAYGVSSSGLLFRFDVTTPSAVTEVGNLGFLPEAIDFRPGSSVLFAIDVGPATSQIYTIDVQTGIATAVGSGFLSSIPASYDLTGVQTFGFDFNPTTLQADNSMRIRLVSSNGANLRLNSSTGTVAAVDGAINGAAATVDGSAYINNTPTMGGATLGARTPRLVATRTGSAGEPPDGSASPASRSALKHR